MRLTILVGASLSKLFKLIVVTIVGKDYVRRRQLQFVHMSFIRYDVPILDVDVFSINIFQVSFTNAFWDSFTCVPEMISRSILTFCGKISAS